MRHKAIALKAAEIKSWDCSDHDPIEDWVPDDPADVEFWCNLAIGLEEGTGADNFQVHVATQKALSRILDKRKVVVIPYYEGWGKTLEIFRSIVSDCEDIDWLRVSEHLSTHFFWEYGDMK